jgi:hypothetical protein
MAKPITTYPEIIDLSTGVELAMAVYPDKYKDVQQTYNLLRWHTNNNQVVGAVYLKPPGKRNGRWLYNTEQLVKWLAEDRKPGRSRKKNQKL